MQPKTINYISNRELLLEIQRSKATYCHFIAPEYAIYDAVVPSLDHLTPELLATLLNKKPNPIVRVMTDSHIPPETNEKAKRRASSSGGWIVKTNFPPFKHYLLSADVEPKEVGRSHWQDGLSNGAFSLTNGNITNRLAKMFMMLVEHYANRYNWRSDCVDEGTEALTQRGWLNMHQINEDDLILSYDAGQLKWSKIKSIYRGDYDGKMFYLTVTGMDALVTPGHKFITADGLKEVEDLVDSDVIVLNGEFKEFDWHYLAVPLSNIDFHGGKTPNGSSNVPTIPYKGEVWCPETEYGSFVARRNGTIYTNGNSYVDEMRNHALMHLVQVGLQFDESRSDNPFAFYTQIVKHVFTRILNLERRNQAIRDDLLIIAEVQPSYTRQLDNDIEQSSMSSVHVVGVGEGELVKKEAKKRGRRPKVKAA